MTIRRVGIVVGINLLLLVAAVVILEIAFGAWVREDSLNRLNLVRDRKLQFSTAHLYQSERGVATYTRDEFGLRGDCGHPAKITVLTLGGSTTDQRYVSDDETWQAVLQRRLRDQGNQVCVGNAGVDGQSTIGNLKNFDWWFPHVPGLKPKYILFYVGINDFYVRKQTAFDDLITPRDDRSLRQLLREYSAFYHLAYTLYGNYQSRVRHRAGHGGISFAAVTWTTKASRADHQELMRPHLEAFRDRLALLVNRTRAMGAEPIFVTQPSHWHRVRDRVIEGVTESSDYGGVSINGVDRHIMMRMLDSVTCEVASSSGARCIDLGARDEWEDADFYDFAHMTPRGADKVGRMLADALAPIVE